MSEITEKEVIAAARALCKRDSEMCGTYIEDEWLVYSEEYKQDALIVLMAAKNAKEQE